MGFSLYFLYELPRIGPDKPAIQPLCDPSPDTAQWIILEVNLGLPLFNIEPCWCMILSISRRENVCFFMEPRILCRDYDSMENNFYKKLLWFSWEIGSGGDQRHRAPGLSLLTFLKEWIFWSCLISLQGISGLSRWLEFHTFRIDLSWNSGMVREVIKNTCISLPIKWGYCSNMDGTRDSHTKWSRLERDKYHMISLISGI